MKIEKAKLEQLLKLLKKALAIGAGDSSYANTLPGDMSGAVANTTESLAGGKKKKKRKQKRKGEEIEKAVNQVIEEDSELLVRLAKGEKIPGGKAAGRPDSDFDSKELAMGIKVEMEHTKDKAKAKEIAKDHLAEFADYYTRLKAMEKKAEKEKKEVKKAAIVVKDPKDRDRAFEIETTKEGKKKLVLPRPQDGKGSMQGERGRGMGSGKGKNKIKGCKLLNANDDISRQKRKKIFKSILKEVKNRFPEMDYQTIVDITMKRWEKRLLEEDSDTTSESDNKQ